MLCKYVLTVDSISYDIPKSCIQNWDEIKFSRKRSGLEGITRTFKVGSTRTGCGVTTG